MAEQRPSSWILPFAAGSVVVAVVLLVVVPVVAVFAGAGPFGNDDPEQTPVVTGERSVTVEMRDFVYFPKDLTVDAGTEVTWVNEDAAPHDATGDDEAWRTEVLNEDESETVVFDTPGTFPYYCSIHPWMKGAVTVR